MLFTVHSLYLLLSVFHMYYSYYYVLGSLYIKIAAYVFFSLECSAHCRLSLSRSFKETVKCNLSTYAQCVRYLSFVLDGEIFTKA